MIEMKLVVGSMYYILISTILANEKENHLALVYGVVTPCYQRHKQGTTTPHNKSLSPADYNFIASFVHMQIFINVTKCFTYI